MLNLHQESVLHAQLRTLHHAMHRRADLHPVSSSLTALMRHGGLYTLLDPDIMAARMGSIAVDPAGRAKLAGLVPNLQAAAASFFSRLVPEKPYIIPSSLMSHIAFPHEGAAYTSDKAEQQNPTKIHQSRDPSSFYLCRAVYRSRFDNERDKPVRATRGSGCSDAPRSSPDTESDR
jgi:hypothetical protein